MSDKTPMMKQYLKLKEDTKDCILFFRLGDFYEMFNDDALLVSRELNLTLTTRDRDKSKSSADKTPMCGVPYHSAEAYIARLIAKGFKVAICEQTEDPAQAKGLVSREVVRIVTPGTIIDSSALDDSKSNYLCSICLSDNGAAICFADFSTSEFAAASFDGSEAVEHIINELVRYSPAEAILNHDAALCNEIPAFLNNRLKCLSQASDDFFDFQDASILFARHFGEDSVAKFAPYPAAIRAAGALLAYLLNTQKCDISHINQISFYSSGHYMELDFQTRRNLELTETLRSRDKRGSLLWVLDKTKTSMGARLLRSWLEKPLLSPLLIRRRLAAVSELALLPIPRAELMQLLKPVEDMERLVSRISLGHGNARDMLGLLNSARALPLIKALLIHMQSALLKEIASLDLLSDIQDLIANSIADNPPFSIREGSIIRSGFNPDVDRLRDLSDNALSKVADIETNERIRTGFKKLKIGYNKVFGYFIEIPRSHSDRIPDDYIRKQTLVNSERFITPELKNLESDLLSAKDSLHQLEFDLFIQLRDSIAASASRIRRSAFDIARLDVLCSLSETAVINNYVAPDVDLSDSIHIVDGRHPVIEKSLPDNLFVPNDSFLDNDSNRLLIITGPNMAGKSTFMRQTALIVLMAQIGSFVPAKSALIGVTDRIFTRIGASDDLASGLSTFMTEMSEVAHILRNASPNSLLILDEIGRGTSTFDGMAIAKAVIEFCADKRSLGAKTLFATHYHELSHLHRSIEGVKILNTLVKRRDDNLIFLRKIVPGAADKSFGIDVAKLAGVPEPIVRRAIDILQDLENPPPSSSHTTSSPPPPTPPTPPPPLLHPSSLLIIDKLRNADLNSFSPIQALNLLFELKNLL